MRSTMLPAVVAFIGLFSLSNLSLNDAEYIDMDIDSPPLYSMHNDINDLLNQQVAAELYASHSYLALAAFFGRDDVNKMGFKKLFLQSANEEFEHAQKFIAYLNQRNGRLHTLSVDPVTRFDFGMPGEAGIRSLEAALDLENKVSYRIKLLHDAATGGKKKSMADPHLADFLESEWIKEQVESVRKIKGHITTLKNMGEPKLAEYLFDKHLLD